MSKPILYTFGLSVWSAVPEIAIVELGYPADAIDNQTINLVDGANFKPQFLDLNPNATLPTLVTGGKAYVNTAAVTRYLVQHAPKKVTPGTTAFISRIHEDSLDPNFILLTARNEDELKAAASGFPFKFVQNRQSALEEYSTTPGAATHKEFYAKKIKDNGGVLAVYKGEVPEDVKTGFFEISTRHWQNITKYILTELPGSLPDTGFIGGETPGEDDFHLGAWLARVAFVTGGTPSKGGYAALEKETKETIPAKVAAYWDAWTERPGWKQTYAESLH